jgi:putative hydrolase of the HAD superfamily
VEAVIFDLGGVVLESPMPVIGRYEAEAGLSAGTLNRVVAAAGPGGSWARLERGEIGRDAFSVDFSSELGGRLSPTDLTRMFEEINTTVTVRRAGLTAIRTIRSMGLLVAALTNNWERFPSGGLRAEFDVFCESVAHLLRDARRPRPESEAGSSHGHEDGEGRITRHRLDRPRTVARL